MIYLSDSLIDELLLDDIRYGDLTTRAHLQILRYATSAPYYATPRDIKVQISKQ